ncbi:MAG: hypothetical protein AAB334_02170 [Patescibacteria group bacterium]|mgnify:FL=1
MKISEITKDNIRIVLRFNCYEKPREIAEKYPELIPEILKYCRIGECAEVLKQVPTENMALQIVEQNFTFAHFLAIRFPEIAVKIVNIITENSDRAKIELNTLISNLPPKTALNILKNIPKYATHILELRPDLEKEAEKIFKLED